LAKLFKIEDTEQSTEHRRPIYVAYTDRRETADRWLKGRAKEQPEKVARGAYVIVGPDGKEEGL
jgi:hypothetical protein